MRVFTYDTEGFYTGTIYFQAGTPTPENSTFVLPPQPMYAPKWDGDKWTETKPPPADVPDGMRAKWNWEAKEWQIVPVQPIRAPLYSDDPNVRDALDFTRGLMRGLGVRRDDV